MAGSTDDHARTSRELLAKAEEALVQGDLLQASEKGWGATAHMVKGLAEMRGWAHGRHREFYQVVDRFAQETGDPAVRTLFDVANALHANFYENWMSQAFVENGLERVREFLDKLERLP